MITAGLAGMLAIGSATAAVAAPSGLPASGGGSKEYGYFTYNAYCNGDMTVKWDGNGNDYARGNFYLGDGSCEGWLERKAPGGQWTLVSGIHLGLPYHQSTGWYWDGPGYLARACVGIYHTDYRCGAVW